MWRKSMSMDALNSAWSKESNGNYFRKSGIQLKTWKKIYLQIWPIGCASVLEVEAWILPNSVPNLKTV